MLPLDLFTGQEESRKVSAPPHTQDLSAATETQTLSIDLSFYLANSTPKMAACSWPGAGCSGSHGLNTAPNHPKIEHGVQSKQFCTVAYSKSGKINRVRTEQHVFES
jgi:hypothetical protein